MSYVQLFGRDDQVVVVNPLNTPYIFMWDGKRYRLAPNVEQPMPGWMADHYVKEMVNLLMSNDERQKELTNEASRKSYYDKIIRSHTKMTSIDDPASSDEIIELGGQKTIAQAKGKVLKVADPDDSPIDKELELDTLPRDEDLFPDPKKQKGAKSKPGKPKADEDDEDPQPGDLAAQAAGELGGEDDDPTIEGKDAFPGEPKA